MEIEKIKTNGGVPARIGKRFHSEIERIKTERIKKGKSKDKISTEKITNLIVRHNDSWGDISKDIINLEEEELERVWK